MPRSTDADPDTWPHTRSNASSYPGSDAWPHPRSYPGSNAWPHTRSDGDTGTKAHADTHSDSKANADAHSNSKANAHSHAYTNPHSHAHASSYRPALSPARNNTSGRRNLSWKLATPRYGGWV